MKKFLLFLLFALPLCATAQHSRYTVRFIDKDNPDDKRRIPYMQFLPPNYSTSPTAKHPLIIFFHGQGESGYGSEVDPVYNGITYPSDIDRLNSKALPMYLNNPATTMTFTNARGVQESFVVLVPQKHKENTFCPPNLGYCLEQQFPLYYAEEMIKYALTNLNVDPNRIFLTGASLGAGIVWDYPAASDANAKQIAAVVPVSGNPVYSYQKTNNSAALLCNLPENGVRSRGYIGAQDDRKLKDSARRASVHINDTCKAQAPYTSFLDSTTAGGHNDPYWNLIYDPAFAGTSPQVGDLNIYRYMINISRTAESGLPVKLKYFKGKSLNAKNILEWATSAERNSDRIELLRSVDGEVYSVVASFKADGNSAADKLYSYSDNNAPKGTSYYQLRQVDKDGKSELSRVVTINNKNQAFIIEKYPNPVTDRLNVKIEGTIFGVLELQVLDLKGNLVKKITIRKDQANWTGFIDVRELAKGMYMFHMKSSDGKKEVSSFIKN